jgi:hydrogenase maturation factor
MDETFDEKQQANNFFLAEFETAFEFIKAIDDRRLRFVEFIITINVLLAGGVVGLAKIDDEFTLSDSLTGLASSAILTACTALIISMLKSERDANLRYRRKINFIRGVFLEHLKDERITNYLMEHRKLGTPTSGTEDLSKTGRTLKLVFWFLWLLNLAWWVSSGLAIYLTIN